MTTRTIGCVAIFRSSLVHVNSDRLSRDCHALARTISTSNYAVLFLRGVELLRMATLRSSLPGFKPVPLLSSKNIEVQRPPARRLVVTTHAPRQKRRSFVPSIWLERPRPCHDSSGPSICHPPVAEYQEPSTARLCPAVRKSPRHQLRFVSQSLLVTAWPVELHHEGRVRSSEPYIQTCSPLRRRSELQLLPQRRSCRPWTP